MKLPLIILIIIIPILSFATNADLGNNLASIDNSTELTNSNMPEKRKTRKTKSSGYLEFTKLGTPNQKTKIIKNGKRSIIWINDSTKIRGKLFIVNADSIRMREMTYAFTEIHSIGKINVPLRFFCTTLAVTTIAGFGYLQAVLGVNPAVFAPSIPLIATNFMRKRLRLRTEWSVAVIE